MAYASSARDEQIRELWLVHLNQSAVAEEAGLSRERVRQILNRIVRKSQQCLGCRSPLQRDPSIYYGTLICTKCLETRERLFEKEREDHAEETLLKRRESARRSNRKWIEQHPGICIYCRKKPSQATSRICRECAAIQAGREKIRRKTYKAEGLCVRCAHPVFIPGETHCKKHCQENRERSRRSYLLRKEKAKAHTELCNVCLKRPHRPNRLLCEVCTEKKRAAEERHLKKKGAQS